VRLDYDMFHVCADIYMKMNEEERDGIENTDFGCEYTLHIGHWLTDWLIEPAE
jgi:hypothetical protein